MRSFLKVTNTTGAVWLIPIDRIEYIKEFHALTSIRFKLGDGDSFTVETNTSCHDLEERLYT